LACTFDGLVHCRIRIALGEALKDVDGPIDLFKKVVCVKVPIAVLASLEDDSGFPGGYEDA
jgi:hypothetical protein